MSYDENNLCKIFPSNVFHHKSFEQQTFQLHFFLDKTLEAEIVSKNLANFHTCANNSGTAHLFPDPVSLYLAHEWVWSVTFLFVC